MHQNQSYRVPCTMSQFPVKQREDTTRAVQDPSNLCNQYFTIQGLALLYTADGCRCVHVRGGGGLTQSPSASVPWTHPEAVEWCCCCPESWVRRECCTRWLSIVHYNVWNWNEVTCERWEGWMCEGRMCDEWRVVCVMSEGWYVWWVKGHMCDEWRVVCVMSKGTAITVIHKITNSCTVLKSMACPVVLIILLYTQSYVGYHNISYIEQQCHMTCLMYSQCFEPEIKIVSSQPSKAPTSYK